MAAQGSSTADSGDDPRACAAFRAWSTGKSVSIAALYRPFTAIARTTRPTQRRDEEYDTTSVVLGDGGPDVPRRVRLAVDTQYIRPRDANLKKNLKKADIVCACLRVMKALRR